MRITVIIISLFLFPALSWAAMSGSINDREYDKFKETIDGRTAIRVKLSNDPLVIPNLTVTGTGERISGNTYGNYLDFNDNADGTIKSSHQITSPSVTVPTSPTDNCNVGTEAWDNNTFYKCVYANTWIKFDKTAWVITRDLLMLDGVQLQLEGVNLQL